MATRYSRDRVATGTMRNGYAFMIICTLLVLLYLVDILRKGLDFTAGFTLYQFNTLFVFLFRYTQVILMDLVGRSSSKPSL